MMAGLIKPQLMILKEGLRLGPKDDDAWKAIATSAALLNESAYLMMDDGRCPDKVWSDGCVVSERRPSISSNRSTQRTRLPLWPASTA